MHRAPLVVIAALVTAACGGGPKPTSSGDEVPPQASGGAVDSSSEPGDPLVEVEGPLIGLVIAASIDEHGDPVEPARIFESAAREITAVASVGLASGGILFEWFSLEQAELGADPERTRLFEHRVAVEPLERAFSVGVSPGTIAAGTYLVEVTFNAATAVAEFEIVGGTDGATRGPEPTVGPPEAGESASIGSLIEASPAQPRADLSFLSTWVTSGQPGGTVTGGPTIAVQFDTSWYEVVPNAFGAETAFSPAERAFSVEGSIGAGGGSVRRTVQHPAGSDQISRSFIADPCRLPGGSDLPGTRLSLDLAFISGGPGEAATSPQGHATLGPDETRPAITTFDTSRPDGARVEAGDVIGFDVIARDQKRAGATWQTGVARLQVRANEELLDAADGPRLPPRCDDDARILGVQGEYEVPDDPPPLIRLCALAEDYAPNVTERCVTYSTTEVWTGSARLRSEVLYSDGSARCEDAWSLDFSFTEADDGTISGEGTADLVLDMTCEPDFPGATSPSREFTYGVEGERVGDSLRISFHPRSGTAGVGMAAMIDEPLTIPLSDGGGSADAAWESFFVNPDETFVEYSTDGTVEVECVGCSPGDS